MVVSAATAVVCAVANAPFPAAVVPRCLNRDNRLLIPRLNLGDIPPALLPVLLEV
jgi:hypothetical protein